MAYFPPGSALFWGNGNVAATADVRFITPGFTAATAALTSTGGIALPKAGALRNLSARHNVAVGNGNNVIYEILINGLPTGFTVTLPSGAVNFALNTTDTLAVSAGDIIEITATKPLALGFGGVGVMVAVDYI